MPQVIRGIRSNSNSDNPASTTSPHHDRRVTFEQGREDSSVSLPARPPAVHHSSSTESQSRSRRRRSSHWDQEERDAYFDSRAASQREFQRRASTLQSYYDEHPDLLPQLPFTFRHGFKRWRLGGYIALMVFDACVVPIVLYYALTFGGNIEGWITFAVVTAIWGGPTYVEFAVRSLRLIKKQRFYKPLHTDKRWAFDITNWILVLTITVVTALLIVGAAPHEVFLRVLSMPGPAILITLCGPLFFLTLYHACGWKAPFRISSTPKGAIVHPGIYYIVEDIVAVNAGGGRPFREGMAARYKASPIFRKMLLDLSWFWSISGLLVAGACTVLVCTNNVNKAVSYGIGWGVPFLWAGVWAAITVPWVQKLMHKERTSWEEESAVMSSTMPKAAASPADGLSTTEKMVHETHSGHHNSDKLAPEDQAARSSASGDTAVDREVQEAHDAAHV